MGGNTFRRLARNCKFCYDFLAIPRVGSVVPYNKTILCLAASRRPGGLCVAGKEFANGACGPWVRPISAQSHAIAPADMFYANGVRADVLDIFTVSLTQPVPMGHQRENHLINNVVWQNHGRATWQQIVTATCTSFLSLVIRSQNSIFECPPPYEIILRSIVKDPATTAASASLYAPSSL